MHYRRVQSSSQQMIVKEISNLLMPYLKNKEIMLTYGKKVLELRPPVKWNKGSAVLWILSKFKKSKILPIYIGDDITDEDAFESINRIGLTFYVGITKSTCASYKLKNVDEVYQLLKKIGNYDK